MPVLTEEQRRRCQGRCRDGCCAVAVVMILMLGGATWWLLQDVKFPDSDKLLDAEKRSVDSVPHGYATNLWWKMMNHSAHLNNLRNCYACSHLPSSSLNSALWPYNLTKRKTLCLIWLSTHPGLKQSWLDADFSKPLDLSETTGVVADLNCSAEKDLLTWGRDEDSVALPNVVLTHHLPPAYFPRCVIANGSNWLGTVPHKLCNKTLSFCPPLDERKCISCLANSDCKTNYTRKTSVCKMNTKWKVTLDPNATLPVCSTLAPTNKGTRVLSDWYYVCGHKAYPYLPAQWGGLCAMVALTDHSFFMTTSETHPHFSGKSKRAVPSYTHVWGLTHDTGVPWEYRIWGGGAKVFQSIIPWVGVGEIRDHVEINRYALLRLINDTRAVGYGVTKELSALREMVLQNRVALDLLTASNGGVCKMIGDTCCTYIPDETGTDGDIYKASQNLTELQQYVKDLTPGAERSPSWIDWLWTGTWWQVLMKTLMPVIAVLIVICVFLACLGPCVKSMVSRAVNLAFVQHQLVIASYQTVPDEESGV